MYREEAMTIFSWFNIMRNEVDITEKDMEVFKKYIEPILGEEFRGQIEDIYKQYENQYK